jgi:hypothetical protein
MIDLGLNEQGKALAARTINKGDVYGLNDCLEHDETEPLIEFYHAATDTDPAYFIGRYYRATLMGECELIPDNRPVALHGLCLCGATGLTATAQQVQTACNAQGHELRLLKFKQLQQA